MAYYLDFSVSTQGRVLCDFKAPATSPDWEVEFKIKPPVTPPDFYRVAGSLDPELFDNRILVKSDGTDFRFSYNGTQYLINPSPSVDLSLEPVISFRSVGSGISLLINGQVAGSSGAGGVGCNLEAIGANFNSYLSGGLYYFKFTDNNNAANSRYLLKESLSGANDSVFNDALGNQDGVQSGTWPSDNSEWVFYSDGAVVTADIAYTVSAPTLSATASASLPNPVSNVNVTVNAPAVLANASATKPSPSADIDYTVSTPTVSASASATIPNPVSDIAFSVSTPNVSSSLSVTKPNFNTNVAFAVNAPSVSISAISTLPQPESAVSFTVSPPSVSVVAIAGGIAIIVDEETNINQRAMSTNINAPILSNNING